MIKGEDESKVVPLAAAVAAGKALPYTVELWDLSRQAPERVIGRAASAVLGRAIYVAAIAENIGRRVVLRRGSQVLSDSQS